MSIAYGVGTAKTNTAAPGRTGNGDLTCTLPTGWTAGHLCLLILWSDQGTGSTPNGWTEIPGSPFGSGTPKLQVFRRFLQAGDSDPVTTISGSTTGASHCANLCTYSGVNTVTPILTIGSAQANTGSPMTALSITTGSDDAVVLGICGRGDNEDASGQAFDGSTTGVTERLDGGTNAGDDSQVSMYDKAFPSLGTITGDGTATTSTTDPWISLLIALKNAPPQTVTLARPSLSLLAQAISGDPGIGGQTVTLARPTLSLLAQSGTAVRGALQVALARALLELQARAATSVPGSISAGMDAATVQILAQAISNLQAVNLDRAVLQILAQSGTAIPGSLSVGLDRALLELLARAISTSAGGPQTVGLDRPSLAFQAQGIGWISPLAVVLRRPELAVLAQALSVVPGPITRQLEAAVLQILAREARQALAVTLGAAIVSLQAREIGFVPGAVSKGLDRATLTIESRGIGYVPGPTSRVLDRAVLQILAQALGIGAGGMTEVLDAALLGFSAREAIAVPGAVTRELQAAVLAFVAQSPAAVPGPLVVTLSPATLALLAGVLHVVGYGTTVVLDAARLEFFARVVLTEGLIEKLVEILTEAILSPRFIATASLLGEEFIQTLEVIEARATVTPAFVLTVELVPAFRNRIMRAARFDSEVEE